MARKINLKGLFDSGQLTVTILKGQNAGFDFLNEFTNPKALFDGQPISSLPFGETMNEAGLILQTESDGSHPSFRLNFNNPILSKKARLIIKTRFILSYNVRINGNPDTDQTANPTVEVDSESVTLNINGGISSILVSAGAPLSTFAHEFYEMELFIDEEAYPYEFNDSVLTTKAWNSSRYSGKQLSSAKINEYTAGDTTFSHTPVISNFSRNIYMGSRVIGMREPGLGDAEDPTLTPFPGFSYITVDDYITVNSDDSITRRSVRSGRGENGELNAKKGFYQAWYQDFPIGTNVEVRPLDTRLAQSLSPRYNIFNNSGQLQKILLVTQNHAVYSGSNEGSLDYDSGSYYAASYNTSSQIFDYCSGSGNPNGTDIGGEFSVFNNLLLVTNFFTGSLVAAPQGVNDPIPSDDLTVAPNFGGGGGIVDNTGNNPIASVVGMIDNSGDDPPVGGDDDGGITGGDNN